VGPHTYTYKAIDTRREADIDNTFSHSHTNTQSKGREGKWRSGRTALTLLKSWRVCCYLRCWLSVPHATRHPNAANASMVGGCLRDVKVASVKQQSRHEIAQQGWVDIHLVNQKDNKPRKEGRREKTRGTQSMHDGNKKCHVSHTALRHHVDRRGKIRSTRRRSSLGDRCGGNTTRPAGRYRRMWLPPSLLACSSLMSVRQVACPAGRFDLECMGMMSLDGRKGEMLTSIEKPFSLGVMMSWELMNSRNSSKLSNPSLSTSYWS